MDKVITTALLIVISMVLALVLFNAAYPAIQEGGQAIGNLSSRAEERMRSQIAIIHAAGEYDADGNWMDSNANGDFEVFLWIKNIGDTRVNAIDRMDIFFGPEGNFMRIPFRETDTDPRPNWSSHVENAAEWTPRATLRITLHYGGMPPPTGRYFVRVTLPNGITADTTFGL